MTSTALTTALEKAKNHVTVADGSTLRAFDALDAGVTGRELLAFYRERTELGDLANKAGGAAVALALIAVEADRKRRLEREHDAKHTQARWERDHEWQEQMSKLTGGVPWRPWGGVEVPLPECWVKGPLRALMGREPLPGDAASRWHVSVAHEDRVPTWDELVDAGHALRPGVVFCVGLPPRSWWLNYAENVLHLWEIRDEALVESWRMLQRGDTPT